MTTRKLKNCPHCRGSGKRTKQQSFWDMVESPDWWHKALDWGKKYENDTSPSIKAAIYIINGLADQHKRLLLRWDALFLEMTSINEKLKED